MSCGFGQLGFQIHIKNLIYVTELLIMLLDLKFEQILSSNWAAFDQFKTFLL